LTEKHGQNYIYYNFGPTEMHLLCPSIGQALDYPFTGQFPPLKNLILLVQEMTQWVLKAKDHHIVYSDCVLGHFIATCLIQKLTEG
jgi:hypothetical protein